MNHGCNLSRAPGAQTDAVDTSMLLHPARHFRNPKDVLNANYLSSEEKRTILASSASDMHAVESKPALRSVPGVPRPILYQDVLSALKTLDRLREKPPGY
ncbi:hypothetical protein [Rhizobium sp. F40D2]|uniref:hypothetical protein n=1 Tax=Rhizobium sp. F40D2 TaxID=3453141 RepID=UPI003F2775F5